jgi:hypothetical protein
MKIRSCFVSNSSSSSFCVLGCYFNTSWLTEENKEMLEDDRDKLFENLSYRSVDYEWFVGLPYTEMKDDETLVQFKERVYIEIKKLCKENVDIKICHVNEVI